MSVSEFAYEIDEAAGIVRFYGDGKYTHETTLGPYASWTEFRTTYLNAGWIDRIPSLPADATEQAEIDAAKCQPAHVEPLVQDAIRAAYEASKTPEPKRAKLPHFNQRTRFNPFKGFKVTYEGEGTEPASFYSKPEQRMNEGGNALHGSAFLLV
jgi:hypothetical protein